MMRLKTLYIAGTWRVLAAVGPDGTCEVEDAINELAASAQTKTTAAGFIAYWSRIPHTGPRALGTDKYHRVDDDNEIYEFIKRAHRILCFEADGALVVCSQVFKKSSGKTPRSEKARAVAIRNEYLRNVALGTVEIVELVGENDE